MQVWEIFPASWRVTRIVCVTFCSITRAQLAEILDHQAEGMDVQALLQVHSGPSPLPCPGALQECGLRTGAPAILTSKESPGLDSQHVVTAFPPLECPVTMFNHSWDAHARRERLPSLSSSYPETP